MPTTTVTGPGGGAALQANMQFLLRFDVLNRAKLNGDIPCGLGVQDKGLAVGFDDRAVRWSPLFRVIWSANEPADSPRNAMKVSNSKLRTQRASQIFRAL